MRHGLPTSWPRQLAHRGSLPAIVPESSHIGAVFRRMFRKRASRQFPPEVRHARPSRQFSVGGPGKLAHRSGFAEEAPASSRIEVASRRRLRKLAHRAGLPADVLESSHIEAAFRRRIRCARTSGQFSGGCFGKLAHQAGFFIGGPGKLAHRAIFGGALANMRIEVVSGGVLDRLAHRDSFQTDAPTNSYIKPVFQHSRDFMLEYGLDVRPNCCIC